MSKGTKRERQKENRERAREERERLMKRDRRMKAIRGLLFLLAPIAVIAIIISATSGDDSSEPKRTYAAAPKMTIDATKKYTATIETREGNIGVELDPSAAPNAVNSFVFLARHHFYDGLCIDRQAKDFVIQGGSPKCDREGGPGYSVLDTPPTDGYTVGALAAAIGGNDQPGSFGSQFFIVTGSGALENKYARFGTVVSGLDVAQKIEKLPVKAGTDEPKKQVKILRITITESAESSSTSAPSSTTSSSTTASTTTTSTQP